MLDSNARDVPFPTTMWTLVEQAKRGERASIDELVRRYATPMFCFLIRNGTDREEAKDIVGDIFLKIVAGKFLGDRFIPRKHRFRSYVLQSLRNQKRDRVRGARHSPDVVALIEELLEHADLHVERAKEDTPEEAFLRQEAYEILNKAIDLAREECVRGGYGKHFAIMASYRLANPSRSWREVGAEFGVDEEVARNLAKTAESKLGIALRKELRLDSTDEADVGLIIREFIDVFSRKDNVLPPKKTGEQEGGGL